MSSGRREILRSGAPITNTLITKLINCAGARRVEIMARNEHLTLSCGIAVAAVDGDASVYVFEQNNVSALTGFGSAYGEGTTKPLPDVMQIQFQLNGGAGVWQYEIRILGD